MSESAEDAGQAPDAGRPDLHRTVTATITEAFFNELAEVGYGKLAVEAVARRAGSGKAAIYRRWKSKKDMAIDLISRAATDSADAPDTGSLHSDVFAFLTVTQEALQHPLVKRILPDLLAAHALHPELADALGAQIGDARREKVVTILRRATERGDLPSHVDFDLGLDLLAGPLFWGSIVRDAQPPQQLDRLTDMIVAALKG